MSRPRRRSYVYRNHLIWFPDPVGGRMWEFQIHATPYGVERTTVYFYKHLTPFGSVEKNSNLDLYHQD